VTTVGAGPTTAVGLACPACGGGLLPAGDELSCERCERAYPVVAGIPDLRLAYPDTEIGWDEDLERARELADRFDELDLVGLLREHWRRSGRPPELAERFLARDLESIGTSAAYLARVEAVRGAALGTDDRFLEVGCGTAGLSIVASERAGEVVASDISMRWLVLAKKRLEETGVERVRLVCCAPEDPAYVPGSFDVVGASDVIEHTQRPSAFVAGCARLLAPGGVLFLATPNRFSLGLEPHVRLWGVGFLPRPLALRYVRRLRGTSYDHVRLLSARGLRRLLVQSGLEARIEAPEIPEATQRIYSGVEARLVRAYNRLRSLPVIRRLLLRVGPFFHVFGRKVN
jgi:2-polyprenyl-3-methyl-5-hydroxy-6-metoxy-1,4-benzoquinol methylase